MRQSSTIRWALLIAVPTLVSCTGERPTNLGVTDGTLAPCPSTPNCVSSDASDEDHYVEPFTLVDPTDAAWNDVREAVRDFRRVAVIEESDNYLRAEFVSAIFRFVDDVELHRREPGDIVAIRSASRLGQSDLGVNRERVEELRELLRSQGVIR